MEEEKQLTFDEAFKTAKQLEEQAKQEELNKIKDKIRVLCVILEVKEEEFEKYKKLDEKYG